MTPYRYISGIPPLRVPWSPDGVNDPESRPGVASSRCGRMSRRHDRSHATPNTVTRPGGTLTPRKIARSYRIDSHALDRSVRQGHLIHSAATSGAFRPASGHIDPIRSRQGDRELLYLTDRAGTHQESN